MIVYNEDGSFYSEYWRVNLDVRTTNMYLCEEDLYGDGLKYILSRLGRSQAWLARETGIPPVMISRYVNKVFKPDFKNGLKMHEALVDEIDRQERHSKFK
jgi:hypothetical protein